METCNATLSIEEMAATLAHEVKSPLSLVKANIDLLELDDNAENHKKCYFVMKRELDKINEIVLELINIAVAEPETTSILLPGLLRELTSTYVETYGHNITFNIDIPVNREIVVAGSLSRLKLAINNVIKNAVEAVAASPLQDETARIDIALTTKLNRRKAVIIIKDNGPGIKKSTAYRTLRSRYTTKQNGSGLGLRATNAIIGQYGGTFNIGGRPNNGCIAKITLPIL